MTTLETLLATYPRLSVRPIDAIPGYSLLLVDGSTEPDALRDARLGADIRRLVEECWADDPSVVSSLEKELAHMRGSGLAKALVGIFSDGTLVSLGIGVQGFACEYLLDVGWISTDPAHRGRGLARAVMDELGRWWKESGVVEHPYLFLSCIDERESLYRGYGFETAYVHRPGALIMIKKL